MDISSILEGVLFSYNFNLSLKGSSEGFLKWLELIYAKLDLGEVRKLCWINFDECAAVLLLELVFEFEILKEW